MFTREKMHEIIAIFRSRAQAIDCNTKLKSMGIAAELISTPKEANIGCGLSVKINKNSAERARYIIQKSNYSAFYGFFVMNQTYGRMQFGRWS